MYVFKHIDKRTNSSVFAAAVFALSLLSSATVFSQDDQDAKLSANTTDARIQALKSKHIQLENNSTALLKRLKAERIKVLEKMRTDVRAQMEEWENDPSYIKGGGLKAALYNAESVAEGYGFDVEKLRAMYQIGKDLILGLEMVGKCGEGSPQLQAIEDAVDSVSSTLSGAMDVFGLAADEQKRLSCVQTEKLKLYREVNRAYIYALTAKEASDAAIGLRRYAGQIQEMAGSDANFLVDQAEKMAAVQDNVVLVFELTPVIGDLIDLYRLGSGNDILGGKLSQFDMALTGVALFTPEIAGQLFKRYPSVFSDIKDFVKEIDYPQGGFFDSLIIRSGQELDDVKKMAGEILDYMAPIGKDLGTRVGTKVRSVAGESITAISKRLDAMPTARWTKEAAIEASNIIPEHMNALLDIAQEKQMIIMLRPFNEQGKKAMQLALDEAKKTGDWIATKWMDVKPKSASNPILGAGIPINPEVSKFDDELKAAIKLGDPAEIAEVRRKINKMKKTMTELFAKRDLKGNPLVGKATATHRHVVEGKEIDSAIFWAHDADGVKVMGIMDEAGNLVDPLNSFKKFDVDPSTAKEVLILTNINGTKILPDYDTFAIGTKSISGDGARGASGELLDESTTYVKNLGNVDRRNLDAMTDINNEIAKQTGVKGNLVHHGSANAWTDLPDFPITIVMPNRTVKSIPAGPPDNPYLWIQEEFHLQTQLGQKGLVPDPSWGWPPYNPRHGYKTPEEIARVAREAAK